jgi:hypothetical protein
MPAGISEAVAAVMEGDGGYATTGFNMRQEREEGNIDEEVRLGGGQLSIKYCFLQLGFITRGCKTVGRECTVQCSNHKDFGSV